MKTTLPLIFLISLLISCNNEISDVDKLASINVKNKSTKRLSIIIQPFEGFSISTTNFVVTQLKEIYSGDVIIRKSIPLPNKALNQTKVRYRADSLIRYLNAFASDGQLIIGLTSKDISTTKGKYKDWGVMGLGFCPGKSCIASTFRLKGKNRLEKLFKVAIHELGHTQGLAYSKTKHCSNKTCFMRDAEGKDHLNELIFFCSKCKPILVKAGWDLK